MKNSFLNNKFFASILFALAVGVCHGQISVETGGAVKIGVLEEADHLTGSSLDIAVEEVYVCPTNNPSASFTISNSTPGVGRDSGHMVPAAIGWGAINQATILAPINAGGLVLGTSAKPIGSVSVQNVRSYSQSYASDLRVKKNISTLADPLENLRLLRPVKFDYDYEELQLDPALSVNRVGFIAQEVQEVYPDLVQYDSMVDLYLLDYVSLIPYLVKGMQTMDSVINEQQELISLYRGEMAEMEEALLQMGLLLPEEKKGSEAGNEGRKTSGNKLFQNAPNPYSGETTIAYQLARNSSMAYIGIYDMRGQERMRISGLQAGMNEVSLKTVGLPAGIYMYSLVVDGRIIDTKRMVITE